MAASSVTPAWPAPSRYPQDDLPGSPPGPWAGRRPSRRRAPGPGRRGATEARKRISSSSSATFLKVRPTGRAKARAGSRSGREPRLLGHPGDALNRRCVGRRRGAPCRGTVRSSRALPARKLRMSHGLLLLAEVPRESGPVTSPVARANNGGRCHSRWAESDRDESSGHSGRGSTNNPGTCRENGSPLPPGPAGGSTPPDDSSNPLKSLAEASDEAARGPWQPLARPGLPRSREPCSRPERDAPARPVRASMPCTYCLVGTVTAMPVAAPDEPCGPSVFRRLTTCCHRPRSATTTRSVDEETLGAFDKGSAMVEDQLATAV